MRVWLVLSGLNGAVAVAAGAFAVHGLRTAGERVLTLMEQAASYQMYHALALGLVAVLSAMGAGGRWTRAAGVLFAIGIILFSGSLYAIALLGLRAGMIAPFGGSALILGWLCLGAAGIGTATSRIGRAAE